MIERIKVRLFLGILFLGMMGQLNAQTGSLIHADSLFNQHKYTEAFSAYHELYNQGWASPSMLLKMAFIQDGLGHYAESLYYMNKYFEQTADRRVIGKIEELAEANNLSGYNYTDLTYFLTLLHKYRLWLTITLTLILMIFSGYIWKKVNHEQHPMGAFLMQVVVASMLFSITNLQPGLQGIIMSDSTLLRSGPSAGADALELLTKGHKVKVLKQDEVWTKIAWDGREGYIRNVKICVI